SLCWLAWLSQAVTLACGHPLKLWLLGGALDGGGPVGEMIQGFSVGGIEVERGDGDGAIKNCGVIGVGGYIFVDALLEKPVVGAAARIFSFAELVSRDFLGLPRELHAAGPWLGYVHVQQHLIGQSLFQD